MLSNDVERGIRDEWKRKSDAFESATYTETTLNTRECILDGFDGPKRAWCYPLKSDDSPSHLIASNDGKVKIHVGKRVVESRFADSDNPTFYYS